MALRASLSDREKQGNGCVICMIKRPENRQERALYHRERKLHLV